MKSFTIAIILSYLLISCSGTKKSTIDKQVFTYSYSLNLNNLEEDQLSVSLDINRLDEETVQFCFPKIVPGIYGALDFGQYIQSFSATDKNGAALLLKKVDQNCWEIANAKALSQITYQVDDSWEEFDFGKEGEFYRSAASSFKEQAFVINNNSLFGYFKGKENRPITLTIERPEYLYGATSLQKDSPNKSTNKDVFIAQDYYQLVDNPILYATPDTTLIQLPGIEVEVACFSTSGKKISKEVANEIRPLLENQTTYLGGKLPVKKYTFLIYHNLNTNEDGYSGDGLEHSNSTLILYYMPMDMKVIKQSVYQIASHEFFHILMPLGLHSHEIADYDFNQPKFSKHLWLYEGMTEYFTIHMPIKNNLQSLEDFIGVLERKIEQMQRFDNTISFTELSANAMQMQDQYYNVYLKGALLNLCLDIQLRAWSDGKYGVQELVFDLIQKYGKNRPFEDDALFEEIIKMTGYATIEPFIRQYIEGNEALPLKESLQMVGLEVEVEKAKIRKMENLTAAQKRLRLDWINQ